MLPPRAHRICAVRSGVSAFVRMSLNRFRDSQAPRILMKDAEQFQRLMADHGITCSMRRSGNVWDNAAMESFFSSLKTERTARKTCRPRDHAKDDVFDYIERFYNLKRRHSTIGHMSPMEFEMQAGLA